MTFHVCNDDYQKKEGEWAVSNLVISLCNFPLQLRKKNSWHVLQQEQSNGNSLQTNIHNSAKIYNMSKQFITWSTKMLQFHTRIPSLNIYVIIMPKSWHHTYPIQINRLIFHKSNLSQISVKYSPKKMSRYQHRNFVDISLWYQ